MRPQWWEWARLEKGGGGGGGGAGESSCSSSQRETSSPLSYVSFTPFHIFLIHLSILLHPPCFLSFLQPLSLSLSLPAALPPSSLRTPDTAHVQSFVWRCPFYYRVKQQKSIHGAEVHLMSTMLVCGCVWLEGYIWLHLLHFLVTCAYVCVFSDVGCIKKSLCKQLACVKAMKSLLPLTLVPILSFSHTHTHKH